MAERAEDFADVDGVEPVDDTDRTDRVPRPDRPPSRWFAVPPVDQSRSQPLTEPHEAPIFDTGPHPNPLRPIGGDPDSIRDPWEPDDLLDLPSATSAPNPVYRNGRNGRVGLMDKVDEKAPPAPAKPTQQPPAPAQPVAVASQFTYLKRWKFALLLIATWIPAAAIGAGLYYWWFHAMDKTWVDFTVLAYLVACTLAGLLVSLVERRPVMSATAIALMSAPLASTLAAGALYGMYVFGWLTP